MSDTGNTAPPQKDLHLQLGELLQKPRSSRKKNQVEQVLQSEIPIGEKIVRIEALDHRPDSSFDSQIDANSAPSEQLDQDAFQTTDIEKQSLLNTKRNQARVKALILPNNFWTYLLVDAGRIKTYCHTSKILTTGLLPFTIKLDRAAVQRIENSIQPTAARIAQLTEHMLDTSWLYLTKHDYNIVSLLQQLCNKLLQINTADMRRSKDSISRKMQPIERCFLALYKESEQFVRLYWTIQQNQDIPDAEAPENRKHLLVYTRRLLHSDPTGPTLTDLILGLNMLRTRRYLSIDQLIQPETGTMVSHQEYDCSEKVRSDITTYLRKLEKSMHPIMQQYSKAKQIRIFLPKTSDMDDEYNTLSSWYDQHILRGESREPVVFKNDEKDIMLLIPRTIQFVLNDIVPLLGDKIRLASGRHTRLFPAEIFSMEIDRLRLLQDKYTKLGFHLPHLASSRYHDIKHNKVRAVSHEAEASYLTDSVFSLCMEIARKLMESLNRNETEATPPDAQIVEEPRIFAGKSPLAAAHFAVSLLLLLAKWNEHPEITSLLRKESQLEEELKSKLSLFERIAHHKLYTQIKERFQLFSGQ